MFEGMNDPGVYEIDSGGKTHSVDVDSITFDDEGLKARKDGVVVAVFRWWDAVRRKDA
jgi:hypothetical protein